MMNEILKLKNGLPEERKNTSPMLEQYILSRIQGDSSGTLIFPDGAIFMTIKKTENGSMEWGYFTRLKPNGLKLLKEAIINEFQMTFIAENQLNSSEKHLLWRSNLNNVVHEVLIGSGSYDSLPSVFRNIEMLINQFIYKMNEKVQPD